MNSWFYNPENDSAVCKEFLAETAKLQIPISPLSGNNEKKKNKKKQANKNKTSNKTNNQKLSLRKKTRIKQTKTQTDFCTRHSLNGNKIIVQRLCYIEESKYFNTDPARRRERTCRSKKFTPFMKSFFEKCALKATQ